MTEIEFKFALISVREDSDGNMQSWLSIEEIGWLDRGAGRESSVNMQGGGMSSKRDSYG